MVDQFHSEKEILAHASWIRGLVRSMIRDEHMAEDLVQDALEAGLRNKGSKPQNPRAWLAGVVRNLYRQQIRSLTKRTDRERRLDHPSYAPSTEELVEKVEIQRRVAKAVTTLPEPYRTTLLLRFYEGHSISRIAVIQEAPQKTVESRIYRGFQLLRRELQASLGSSWAGAVFPLAIPTGQDSPAPLAPFTVLMTSKITSLVAAIAILACFILFWPSEKPSVLGRLETEEHIVNSPVAFTAERDDRTLVTISNELKWMVKVLASGKTVEEDGALNYRLEGNGEVQSAAISEGICFLEEADWFRLAETELPRWFLPNSGFPCQVGMSQILSDDNDIKVLSLDIGDSTKVSVSVSDYRGNPISGAMLQVYGAIDPFRPLHTTDSLGKWSGSVFGYGRKKLVVHAKGYGTNGAEVLIGNSEEASFELQLGRILATGLIMDRRERYSLRERIRPAQGSRSFPSNLSDSSEAFSEIEGRFQLNPQFEFVKWNKILETEWFDLTNVVSKNHPDEVTHGETIEISFQHVLNPEFTLFRFSGDWPKEYHLVQVSLGSPEQIPHGGYPERILMKWTPTTNETKPFSRAGHLIDDRKNEYSFFVPRGEYNLGTFDEISALERGRGPQVIEVERFHVAGEIETPKRLQVRLKEGCFFASYILENSSGLQLLIRGMILEIHAESERPIGFGIPLFPWPQRRFFSEGPCQLWISPSGGLAIPIGEPMTIVPSDTDGPIRITLSPEELKGILSN